MNCEAVEILKPFSDLARSAVVELPDLGWKNYRSTEQFPGHERFRFQAGSGIYDGMNKHDAFQVLAERVDDAIAAGNAATLHVLPDRRNFKVE